MKVPIKHGKPVKWVTPILPKAISRPKDKRQLIRIISRNEANHFANYSGLD